MVPTAIFKADCAAQTGVAGVYVAANAPSRQYQVLLLGDFARRYSIVPATAHAAAA